MSWFSSRALRGNASTVSTDLSNVSDPKTAVQNLKLPILTPEMYGAKNDGSVDATPAMALLSSAVQALCAAGSPPRVVASGRYLLRNNANGPQTYTNRYAVYWNRCDGAVFDFGGATWLFDGRDDHNQYANTMVFDTSPGIKGDLGTFDWVKLPFAQGVVASKTSTTVDITLDAGFAPTWVEAQRVELYTRARVNQYSILGKTLSGADTTGWTVSYPSAGVMRIDFTGDSAALTYLGGMQVGALYVVTYRMYGAGAVYLKSCTSPSVKVEVLAAADMAVRPIACTDASIDVRVRATGSRLISTTADGLQFNSCRGQLTVKGYVAHCGDDPMNISTDSYRVTAVPGAQSFTASYDYPYVLPVVGDSLVAVANDGTQTAIGQITAMSGSTITVNGTFPGGFGTAFQVVNLSSVPDNVLVDIHGDTCRGYLRASVPRLRGTLFGTYLSGVTIEYIPHYFGEGEFPDDAVLAIDVRHCGELNDTQGAVNLFTQRLDGTSSMIAGSMKRPRVDLRVVATKGSALYASGISKGLIRSVYIDGVCSNPNTSAFAWHNKALAFDTCDDVFIPVAYSTAGDTTPSTVYKANCNRVAFGMAMGFTTDSGLMVRTDGTIRLPSGTGQFPSPALYALPSPDPTSERAAIRIGNLSFLQDTAGLGASDFGLYSAVLGNYLMTISATGVPVFNNIPTSASGLASGSFWRDVANGNVIKQVP
jgi:hypothetical protein